MSRGRGPFRLVVSLRSSTRELVGGKEEARFPDEGSLVSPQGMFIIYLATITDFMRHPCLLF